MAVLVTVALAATRAHGFPADCIAVEWDDPAGLEACLDAGEDPARRTPGHDVVEVWRLDPGGAWGDESFGDRVVKVAVWGRSGWEGPDGQALPTGPTRRSRGTATVL